MVARTLKTALILLSLTLWIPVPASALSLPGKSKTAAEEPKPAETPHDTLGRDTPRGMILGFLEAAGKEDWTTASAYLDLGFLSKNQAKLRGPELAQGLVTLLNQGGSLMPSAVISDDPAGKPNDTLEPAQDRIGTLRSEKQSIDLLAELTKGPNDQGLWLVSGQTLKQVPDMLEEIRPPRINGMMPAWMSETKWAGVPVGHWAALVELAVIAYFIAWGLTLIIGFVARTVWRRIGREEIHIFEAFIVPARMYMAVWIFVYAGIYMGISALARQHFSLITVIVGWLSLFLLVWRLIDIIADRSQQHMSRVGKLGMMSVIHFLRRSAKFIFLALAAIVILDAVGVNVTTGLAALGIGGIALALGAQKTVENFVGSLMLIVDQPVRLGDYCKIGNDEGTVEDIGMRSTRLRTAKRTVVTIPNGDFSSQRIENFSRRERYLFSHKIGMRYETTPDQMRWLLVELRALLYAHPKVSPDPARVRFVQMDTNALILEFYAFILTPTFDEFLEVQEDLLLRIMETVSRGGAGFAFPSQTVYNANDKLPPVEAVHAAEAQVQQWRDSGELQLPKFDADHIDKIRGTIEYPPKGAVREQETG
jgi:MscS family membrane protein